jgi:hypothetical protein
VKFREGVDGNALLPIGLMKAASGKSAVNVTPGARREEGIVSDASACGQYATIMHMKPCDAVDEAVWLWLLLVHLPGGHRRPEAERFS